MVWILILVLGGAEPRCDLIEVNHVYSEDGIYRFTQVVAWEWIPDSAVHRAQDWKIIKGWQLCGDCLVSWGDEGRWRARYRLFRETWTTFDVEMKDRELFPVEKRIGVFSRN